MDLPTMYAFIAKKVRAKDHAWKLANQAQGHGVRSLHPSPSTPSTSSPVSGASRAPLDKAPAAPPSMCWKCGGRGHHQARCPSGRTPTTGTPMGRSTPTPHGKGKGKPSHTSQNKWGKFSGDLMNRRREGKCLHCGSSSHKHWDCPILRRRHGDRHAKFSAGKGGKGKGSSFRRPPIPSSQRRKSKPLKGGSN